MQSVSLHSLGGSAAAVQHHYDVGNEFFQLWLGPELVYSAALWQGSDTLETAQIRQIDYHIQESQAATGARVLDIGCGWGATLKRLVNQYGVQQAIGLNLSQAQIDWVQANAHPQIEARLESWLDHTPEQPYDAIIAVEILEHCARPGITGAEKLLAYRAFFERCHQWLRPGGHLSLQATIYGNMQPEEMEQLDADAIEDVEAIFPESEFPQLSEIVTAIVPTFELVQMRCDRHHYARTLQTWFQRLQRQREMAVRLVGEATVAHYERFFQYSRFCYHAGATNLVRMTLRRVDKPWYEY